MKGLFSSQVQFCILYIKLYEFLFYARCFFWVIIFLYFSACDKLFFLHEEEGRKLDFSQVEKQLESVSELMKKLIPPKSTTITESSDKEKSMSFKHFMSTDPSVQTNPKVAYTQTTLNKVMSVKKKLFFPEKLRLKSTMNGIVFVVCVPVLSPQFNFSEFHENVFCMICKVLNFFGRWMFLQLISKII